MYLSSDIVLVARASKSTAPTPAVYFLGVVNRGGQCCQSGISFNRGLGSIGPTPLERARQSHSCRPARTPVPPSYIPCAATLSTRICRDLRERFGAELRSP